MILNTYTTLGLTRGRANQRPAHNSRPPVRSNALKRPSQLLPPTEDKALQCLVETGIRGSVAMLAVTALQLDVFSHIQWQLNDVLVGAKLAVPCIAVDAALLILYTTLSGPASAHQLSSSSSSSSSSETLSVSSQGSQQQTDQAAGKAALLSAIDSVYLHNIRYSLIGATAPGARLALEAGAQASEELLARGALLGCASAWLTNRFLEASLCGDVPLLLPLEPLSTLSSSSSTAVMSAQLLPCGTGPAWLAAAGLCIIMASRFVVHSRGKAAATRSERETAAAEAAARRAVLRYEPLAVQQAAVAAAGGELRSEIDAEAAAMLAAAEAEVIERLAQGWLGARFVLGQACMFGAYIVTDNLLASFTAGLAMQLVASLCCDRYLQRSTA